MEDLPSQKKQLVRYNVGKEVMLNVGGRKNLKVEIISAAKGTNHDLTIPLSYQQDENSVENSCVWLATCLLIRSVNEALAEVILNQYHDNPPKIEWLYMFNKGAPDNRTLFNYLQWTK